MNAQRKAKKRIDYRIFNSTGEKVSKQVCSSDNPSSQGGPPEDLDQSLSSAFNSLSLAEENLTLENESTDLTQDTLELTDQIQEQEPLADLTSHIQYQELTTNIVIMADNQLVIQEGTISQDIDDFLEENVIKEIGNNVADHDDICRRIETLRTSYRGMHNQLKASMDPGDYKDKYEVEYNERIQSIKDYIKCLKSKRRSLRDGEDTKLKDESEAKETKFKFLEQQISDSITRLDAVFSIEEDDWKIESDEDVSKRKNNITKQSEEVQSLTVLFKDMMDCSPGVVDSSTLIDNQKKRYEMLMSIKHSYVERLRTEVKSREIEERKAFDKTKLNIKLPKFGGYKSTVDIYTFKTNFEKIHKTTPKSFLPDLLKNNFLEDSALLLVKDVAEVNDIWKRLKEAYGDCRILLQKKLEKLDSLQGLWTHKAPEKVIEGLSRIINLMRDLMHLAKDHSIENKLYLGDSLERITAVLGENQLHRWLTLSCDKDLSDGEHQWVELITFLEKEIKINQQKVLLTSKKPKPSPPPPLPPADNKQKKDGTKSKDSVHHSNDGGSGPTCFICGQTDHVVTSGPRGVKLVQYFACPKFVKFTCEQRLAELQSKGLCHQCLYPGAHIDRGKHKEGKCQREFICKHLSHGSDAVKKHVLVCALHKGEADNGNVLKDYISRCISKKAELKDFSRNIAIHHVSYVCPAVPEDEEEPCHGDAIYMLQSIMVDGERYNILYDSACRRFAVRHQTVQRLGHRAREVLKGPTPLGGVSGMKCVSPYGVYQVKLPLANGQIASFTGACMEVITETFPSYPLEQIQADITASFIASGGKATDLPKLPGSVGGDTDLMIGMQYNRYIPEEIFKLPSGLAIYRSHFKNLDGTYGVCGGPHPLIAQIDQQFHGQGNNFISQQYHLFKMGYQVDVDIRMLGYKQGDCDHSYHYDDSDLDHSADTLDPVSLCSCCAHSPLHQVHAIQARMKRFEEVERAGSEISFRCIKCRVCQDCKNHDSTEAISIREEVENDIIKRSVRFDQDNQKTIAKLPLIADPAIRLSPNAGIARKVYDSVVKRLNKNPTDKASVIKAEKKLHDRGFVGYVSDLSEEQRKVFENSAVKNFLPWRVVFKSGSLSTPVRPVFDASMPTPSGESLNDLLAKGSNKMNMLIEMYLRWRTHMVAYHNDVNTMYNQVELEEAYWVMQRYWWHPDLDPNEPPVEKFIKSIIYGCRSSSNQAEYAIRLVASTFKDEFPEIHEIIMKDSRMILINEILERLQYVVNQGSFTLKTFTVSGRPPDPSVSEDGVSIGVAGHRWFPEKDIIAYSFTGPNFAQKRRGKVEGEIRDVPKKLKRVVCCSKVAEIYDTSGLLTPITATFKVDLRSMVKRKLDWQDILPDNLRSIWVSHFELMEEIKNVRYNRAVIPSDAVSLDVTTLEFGDASKELVCVAIYARYLRKCGTYSCQLIFARSRLVPDGMTTPRGELFAALINTHTAEVLHKALKKHHKGATKFTDSQIVLFWISNDMRIMKTWLRNRVNEIRRLTKLLHWLYIKSTDMIADLGTRRCTSISAIDQDSAWINGFWWMLESESSFPGLTADEISLNAKETEEASKEVQIDPRIHDRLLYTENEAVSTRDLLKERYLYSDYLIDPNRHEFSMVIRILSIMINFIRSTQESVACRKQGIIRIIPDSVEGYVFVSDVIIKEAEMYFYRKASDEVKRFLKPHQYKTISRETNGVLYYTGRILPEDNVTIVGQATEVMRDLSSATFCVPLTDKSSPIAYSLINDVHWNNKTVRHTGVESTWRYVLKCMYIIDGRPLVKKFRESCQRCRYLMKKALNVSMGPISNDNIMIAPAYYVCQGDLVGPFTAYSYHNKRTTIKIWMVVFCCSTTTATNIKVMERYDTSSFLQAFMRFSCEVGYPKRVLIDDGGQLVKGTDSVRLDIQDIKFQLHKEAGVEVSVCPVGGHNMHGRVERKIRQVRESLGRALSNDRLGVLQWETLAAAIANSINNLPLSLGDQRTGLESMDLITPNRLLLGRNNDRCPAGTFSTEGYYDKIIAENQRIFNSWFEIWLLSHVPRLMEQPKWFKNDRHLKEGDIVLFLKHESEISSSYQYGMIEAVEHGRDGRVRKVLVRYRNHSEDTDRTTYRSARSLVVIHPVDEINIIQELGQIASEVDQVMRKSASEDQ